MVRLIAQHTGQPVERVEVLHGGRGLVPVWRVGAGCGGGRAGEWRGAGKLE